MGDNKTGRGKLHYAWIVLIGLCGAQFFSVSVWYSTASLYLPYITKELEVSTTSLALYLTIHGLIMAFFTSVVARKINKLNVRVLLTVGNIGLCLIIMLMSRFTSVWQWYAASICTGAFAACVQILTPMLIINNWFLKKVGLANGIFWASSGLGGVIFSPVVSNMLAANGWRSTYLIMGAIGLIGPVLLVFPLVRFKPEDKGVLPYGADEKPGGQGNADAYKYGPPEKEAVKSTVFVLTLAVTACLTLAGSFQSLMPTFASNINMLAVSGLMLSCYQIGNTIAKFLLPTLVDKLKIAMTTAVGCAAGILGGICLILASTTGHTSFLLAGAVLLGVAAASMSLIPMIVRASYGTNDYGKLYSYHQITQTLIGCVSITVYSLIIEQFGVAASIGVIIAALIIAVGSIFSAIKKSKKKFGIE